MELPEEVKHELDSLLGNMSKEMLLYRLFIQMTIGNTVITNYIADNKDFVQLIIVKYIVESKIQRRELS